MNGVNERMKIHLHVGVHKTASTLIQKVFAANRTMLNLSGIGFMPMTAFRKSITSRLYSLSGENFSLAGLLPDFFPDARPDVPKGIIVSDESLIGNCRSIVHSGKPYVSGAARLAVLHELLAEHEVSLFVSLREYGSFISAAYCETLRHHGEFVRFDKVRRNLDKTAFCWPALLESFRESLKPAEIKIWRFESFFENSDAVMRAMAFQLGGVFDGDSLNAVTRPSFSHAAVEALQLIADRIGPDAANRLVMPITRNLPKGKDYPAFDPWTEEERSMWREKYERDCRQIPNSYWLLPADRDWSARAL
ncbi:MAG: hypothetical protein ACT4SY_01065 [Hyphomicrobiales bacterium]